jgi:hypothetical protein
MSEVSVHPKTQTAFLAGGWIRSRTFDLNLIATVMLVALLFGLVSLIIPTLFLAILILDLWLLGYHHVVSTFTRLVFDKASFREHRFLVIQLPLIVIAGTLFAVWAFGYWMPLSGSVNQSTRTIGQVCIDGLWILPTTYLYWQWFHYTRQSYGIERMFRRSSPEGAVISDRAGKLALYSVPLFGIAYRSWQANPKFLFMDVVYVPMPFPLLCGLGVLAAAALGYWLFTLISAARVGCLSAPHTLYLCSHFVIFATGYLLIPDITVGWLVLNVWHNLQYIIFVWWFNNKRFKNQIDPEAPLLSKLSQTKSIFSYVAVCTILGSLAYFGMDYGSKRLLAEKAALAVMIPSMIMNFHHYLVDGIIWKRRKMKVPSTATPVA